MATITRQFPRAPSIYGQKFVEQTDFIMDLAHDIYRRCYFKDCEIIIPDTQNTLIVQTIQNCQFDDCKITLLQRHGFDTPLNRARQISDKMLTLMASHIDVSAMEGRPNNLTNIWLAPEIKDKLGMAKSMVVMNGLKDYAKLFSYRFN